MSRREGLPLCCPCVHNHIPSPGDTGSTSLRTLRLHPTSRNPQRSLACLHIPVTHATVPRDTPTCRQHCPGSGNRFKVASAMWGYGCKGYLGHKGQRTGGDSLAAMHVVWTRPPPNFQGNPKASQKGSEGDQECGSL